MKQPIRDTRCVSKLALVYLALIHLTLVGPRAIGGESFCD